MRDLARRDPRAATLMRLPESAIQRAWRPLGDDEWEWDRKPDGRQWYRFGSGAAATYSFQWVRNEDSGGHEGRKLSADDWTKLGVHVPVESAADALPAGEWDAPSLGRVLIRQGLPGVCNALTAGYLAGLIFPGEGKTGVRAENIAQIQRLKGMLDQAVTKAGERGMHDAAQVSLWFIQWAERNRLDARWLANLSGAQEGIALNDFDIHLRRMHPAHPQHAVAAAATAAAVGGDSGRYVFMFERSLRSGFATALTQFDPTRDARGIVVARMEVVSRWKGEPVEGKPPIGHELAITYDSDTNLLMIYDQNTGKKTSVANDGAAIAAALAAHVYATYVQNPPQIGGTPVNRGSFELRMLPQAAASPPATSAATAAAGGTGGR
ncbi:MAG: hypothetical protein H6675_06200 [Dehalococcoidia bacterium]|nr:hypothetical protein [Dehalococcoidia bacterium]